MPGWLTSEEKDAEVDILIGHFSDTHGYHHSIFEYWKEMNGIMPKPDVWVSSGDFFGNFCRNNRELDIQFQSNWFDIVCSHFFELLDGIPLLSVDGNHDFVKLADLMVAKGYPAQTITPEGLEFGDKVFSGFPEIPMMKGEWNGESTEEQLFYLVERALKANPDILVTHAPPLGVLSEQPHYGNKPLAEMLETYPHFITHAFSGHCHKDGGKQMRIWDTQFINSACTLQFVEV
jgi:Icc-related predicted phosphoesterase